MLCDVISCWVSIFAVIDIRGSRDIWSWILFQVDMLVIYLYGAQRIRQFEFMQSHYHNATHLHSNNTPPCKAHHCSAVR